MLSWVTNTPELTDALPRRPRRRPGPGRARGGHRPVRRRPEGHRRLDRVVAGRRHRRTEAQQLAVHHELGAYHRERYATYLRRLHDVRRATTASTACRSWSTCTAPAGAAGRRSRSASASSPQSYAGVPQMTSGLRPLPRRADRRERAGPLRHERFMAAVHDADQPLTSLEFEAGTGDYGEDLSRLHQPRDDRAQDPALRRPGQPADQLLPVRRRPQPAARRAVGRRQRPDRLHRRTARLRRADRPGGPAQHDVPGRWPSAVRAAARRGAPARRHGRGARRRRARASCPTTT